MPGGEVLLVLAAATLDAGCYAAARDVAAGTPLAAADVSAVPCRADAPRAALRYDRHSGATLAADALAAGTYLGRLAPLGQAQVAKGEALTLRSTAGPVTIERAVTAMQPGRAGGKVFVRDANGQVFAARLALEGAQ